MKRILSLTISLAVAIAYIFVPSVNADGADPSTTIAGHNLSLEDRVNIVYYVTSQDVPTDAEEGILIWVDEPELYAYGTEDYKITTFTKSGQYKLFFFDGLAAKQMTVEVRAMSYIKVGDELYCSEVDSYSIAEYCNRKLTSTTVGADGVTTLGSVVKTILKYGAASQKYLGYNLDNLAWEGEDYTIDSCEIDSNGHLIIHYTTGESIDVGQVTGEDGKSAYDLACEIAGFEGTEQEWLASLKGEDGVGISSIEFNQNGELIITLTDGSTNNAGIVTPPYDDGHALLFELLDDGTYGVKAGACISYNEVTIPSVHKGKAVTKVLDEAFKGAENLERVNLPSSIKIIGEWAFFSCEKLETINLSKVEILMKEAFGNCTSLSDFGDLNNMISIGNSAFAGCKSLPRIIDLPNTLSTLDSCAFGYCDSIQSVNLPDSLQVIGGSAFTGCISLQTINLPTGLTSLGTNAFYGCISLSGIINIPTGITTIEAGTFNGCLSLNGVIIGENVTTIGPKAFYDCQSISNVEIAGMQFWNSVRATQCHYVYDESQMKTVYDSYTGLSFSNVNLSTNYRSYLVNNTKQKVKDGLSTVGYIYSSEQTWIR